MQQELIKRDTIREIAERVMESKRRISQAFDILDAENVLLTGLLGEYRSGLTKRRKEEVLQDVNYDAWNFILQRSGAYEFCSIAKREEIYRQMEDKKSLPDFTPENVYSWLKGYAGNLDTLFEASIKEVFDWLKPWNRDTYKTNMASKEVIAGKVIKEHMFETCYLGYPRLYYSNEKYIQALDNVFHLMDGKGISKQNDPGTLLYQIKEAEQSKGERTSCESDYFLCKWFKKGTLHIEFKRPDLLAKINQKAGGMNLSADLFGKEEGIQKVDYQAKVK